MKFPILCVVNVSALSLFKYLVFAGAFKTLGKGSVNCEVK